VAGGQETIVTANAAAWEVNVSGAANREMDLRIKSGATLTTFAGINVEEFGSIQLADGNLDAQYVEILGGSLSGNGVVATGSGPIAGQVENRGGVVSPGVGVGTLSIGGRFANSGDGAVVFEVGGLSAGIQYDRLIVEGVATLGGVLNIDFVDLGAGMFMPGLGNEFSIITAAEIGGEFSTLNLPSLPGDRMWHVGYGDASVVLKVTLPGDFDGNFSVDGADLDVWRAGFGEHYFGADLLAWQRNLGASLPPTSAVPEPSGWMLAIAFGGIVLRRRTGGL
jgi:hypothetical protein